MFIPHFSVLGNCENNIFVVNINRYYIVRVIMCVLVMREEGRTVRLILNGTKCILSSFLHISVSLGCASLLFRISWISSDMFSDCCIFVFFTQETYFVQYCTLRVLR